MGKKTKDCNCKAKKDINKLVKTIDDINLSSGKTHFKKRGFINKSMLNSLKYLFYILLILIFIVLFIPIILFIILYSIILKKQFILKIPFQKYKKSI